MASNSNNRGHDGYHASLESNMAAYDQLPKAVRQALQASDHNWSARQCLIELRRPKSRRRHQFANARTAAGFILEQDHRKHVQDAESGMVAP